MNVTEKEAEVLPCGCEPNNVLAECESAKRITAGLNDAWQRADIQKCYQILVAWSAHRGRETR
jgi:hypothetical protein